MKKIAFFLPLLIVLGGVIGNIIMSARLSDVGAKIQGLELKNEQLTVKSEVLIKELATMQSLPELKTWAAAQGFVKRGAPSQIVLRKPQLASSLSR